MLLAYTGVDNMIGVDKFNPRLIGQNERRPIAIDHILTEMKLDPTTVTLLTDHHIYEACYGRQGTSVIQQLGLDKIEIRTICPCCVVNDGNSYNATLREKGFKVSAIELADEQTKILNQEAYQNAVEAIAKAVREKLDQTTKGV